MEAWKEHFTQEEWDAMVADPDYPWEELLTFYRNCGNDELPVIQSVIAKIESVLNSKSSQHE